MNLSGKQKSQLLISLVEDNSTDVLKHLSEESATVLTSTLEDIPSINQEDMDTFLTLVLESISEKEFELPDKNEESRDDLFESETFDESDIKGEGIDETLDDESKEEVKYPQNYRSIEKIAAQLTQQENQMAAFFFVHTEEEFSKSIQKHMPEEKIEAINKCKVESTPMSERVFKRLFDMIVLKTEEEIEEEEQRNQDEESGTDTFEF